MGWSAAKHAWSAMTDQLPGLDDAQMLKWMELIERRTGVTIPPERKSFMAVGLRACMRETEAADYDGYYRLLTTGHRWSREWAMLMDRITVHETSFFRHAPSLELLTGDILPGFLARNSESGRCFHAWSLGCSTGEEPYSLAMVIDGYMQRYSDQTMFGITATDISQPSLDIGRKGVYGGRRLSGVPEELRERYFRRVGDDAYQVVDRLRRRVCFSRVNVVQLEQLPLRDLDLIYCQNMLIYFSRGRRLDLLRDIAKRLAPGGVLVLGPGDMPSWSHPEFERIRFEGTLAYRRLSGAVGNA